MKYRVVRVVRVWKWQKNGRGSTKMALFTEPNPDNAKTGCPGIAIKGAFDD